MTIMLRNRAYGLNHSKLNIKRPFKKIISGIIHIQTGAPQSLMLKKNHSITEVHFMSNMPISVQINGVQKRSQSLKGKWNHWSSKTLKWSLRTKLWSREWKPSNPNLKSPICLITTHNSSLCRISNLKCRSLTCVTTMKEKSRWRIITWNLRIKK